jgi:hypothetical protein
MRYVGGVAGGGVVAPAPAVRAVGAAAEGVEAVGATEESEGDFAVAGAAAAVALDAASSRLADDAVTGEVGVEEATEADTEAAFAEVGADVADVAAAVVAAGIAEVAAPVEPLADGVTPGAFEPDVPTSALGAVAAVASSEDNFAEVLAADFATAPDSSEGVGVETAGLRVARFATAGAASLTSASISALAADFVVPFAADLAAADAVVAALAEAADLVALASDSAADDSSAEEPDSTSDASATAVAVAAAPPAFANHSRIVSARPTDTGERWVATSGISSAWQRATMSLELTPSSLAS